MHEVFVVWKLEILVSHSLSIYPFTCIYLQIFQHFDFVESYCFDRSLLWESSSDLGS